MENNFSVSVIEEKIKAAVESLEAALAVVDEAYHAGIKTHPSITNGLFTALTIVENRLSYLQENGIEQESDGKVTPVKPSLVDMVRHAREQSEQTGQGRGGEPPVR